MLSHHDHIYLLLTSLSFKLSYSSSYWFMKLFHRISFEIDAPGYDRWSMTGNSAFEMLGKFSKNLKLTDHHHHYHRHEVQEIKRFWLVFWLVSAELTLSYILGVTSEWSNVLWAVLSGQLFDKLMSSNWLSVRNCQMSNCQMTNYRLDLSSWWESILCIRASVLNCLFLVAQTTGFLVNVEIKKKFELFLELSLMH